jgi:hypothetical protein
LYVVCYGASASCIITPTSMHQKILILHNYKFLIIQSAGIAFIVNVIIIF